MINTLVSAALAACSVILISMGVLFAPARLACPIGTYLSDGVSRAGWFVCRRTLTGTENDAEQPPGVLVNKVYCTGGSVPIVINERTVGCTRLFGS